MNIALLIPFDRITPIDGHEVRVGCLLVDVDYVPYDGVGVVTAVTPGPVVTRVDVSCLADDELIVATINMKERVFVGSLADVTLAGGVTYEAVTNAIAAFLP
jgi:hypothetical protein